MESLAPPSPIAPAPSLAISPFDRSPRWVLAAVLVVIALSAAVRIVDLDRFDSHVFDEYYYVHDANVILDGAFGPTLPDTWRPGEARSAAHPHLGTLTIAAGIAALGDDPWGWRLPSALAGTALIALIFPLGRRMGLDPVWALVALVFVAADTMLIVESRLGVLDIFVTLWGVTAVYLALRCVQSQWSWWWLGSCGAALGLAVATKWSGVLAWIAVAVVLALNWRREGRPSGRKVAVACALLLLALPFAVYFASFAPYLASGHSLGDWYRLHEHMLTFNWSVEGNRSFASAAATWPFDVHPIWYRWMLTDEGTLGLIAIGNPLLWWGAAAAFIGLGVLALTRRRADLALAPLLAAAFYLPWLATSRQGYIYYMAPAVPLLGLLVATALRRVAGPGSTQLARIPATAFAIGCLTAALGYWTLGAAQATVGWAGDVAGWAGVVALVVLVVLAVVVAARALGREAARAAFVWLYAGAVVGVPIALLPFLLGFPVDFEYYDRLMIFTTWR